MTREKFIRKWLGNRDYPYTSENRDLMRDDLDVVIKESIRFIYLITNETDMTVESAWFNFDEAKKECQKWEKMKPQKQFMVVELPINGG